MARNCPCVFAADSNGSLVEIYRTKRSDKWVFKAVQSVNPKYPFLYSGEADDVKYLMKKSGWRETMKEALDDTLLDIFVNYVEMNMHHSYAGLVRGKIATELEDLGDHLLGHVKYVIGNKITRTDRPLGYGSHRRDHLYFDTDSNPSVD